MDADWDFDTSMRAVTPAIRMVLDFIDDNFAEPLALVGAGAALWAEPAPLRHRVPHPGRPAAAPVPVPPPGHPRTAVAASGRSALHPPRSIAVSATRAICRDTSNANAALRRATSPTPTACPLPVSTRLPNAPDRVPRPDLRLLRHADRLGERHLHRAPAAAAQGGRTAIAGCGARAVRPPRIGAGGGDAHHAVFGRADRRASPARRYARPAHQR